QRILRETHADRLSGVISAEESRRDRLRRLLATVGDTADDGEIERALAAQKPAYRAARRAAPMALALLTELRLRGIKTGIVTNNFVGEQLEKLEACGLAPLIDVTVISEEAGCTKPSPEIFRIALDRLGLPAASTRMVGDSWENDVLGALAAGIKAFWFDGTP